MLRLVVTVLVAGVFLLAAIAKIVAPIPLETSFAFLLPALKDHPDLLIALPGAVAGVEAALALLILSGWSPRAVLITTIAVLTAFTVALLVMLVRAGSPSCGCFGAPSAWRPEAEHLIGIVRNIGLISFVFWLLSTTREAPNEPSPAFVP